MCSEEECPAYVNTGGGGCRNGKTAGFLKRLTNKIHTRVFGSLPETDRQEGRKIPQIHESNRAALAGACLPQGQPDDTRKTLTPNNLEDNLVMITTYSSACEEGSTGAVTTAASLRLLRVWLKGRLSTWDSEDQTENVISLYPQP